MIWYADLDRETVLKKNPIEGFKGIDANLINGISGEILSLQSLSEKQRNLEKDLNHKLEQQRSEVVFLRYLLITLIGLAVGLIGWALKGVMGTP